MKAWVCRTVAAAASAEVKDWWIADADLLPKLRPSVARGLVFPASGVTYF